MADEARRDRPGFLPAGFAESIRGAISKSLALPTAQAATVRLSMVP